MSAELTRRARKCCWSLEEQHHRIHATYSILSTMWPYTSANIYPRQYANWPSQEKQERPACRATAGDSKLHEHEPPSPPVITGARDMYESHDDIQLRCLAENFPVSGPTPGLTWLLQGRPARREYVSPYRDDPYAEPIGVTLRMPASQVSRGGGSVEAECLLKLGTHELRSSTTLRVRHRPSSYLSNYFSAAG
nr:uncharacterized protein LOC123759495 [Procambarus clarkii]